MRLNEFNERMSTIKKKLEIRTTFSCNVIKEIINCKAADKYNEIFKLTQELARLSTFTQDELGVHPFFKRRRRYRIWHEVISSRMV